MICKNILFVSPTAFAGLHQRHQAFAELLAQKGYRVYFLDPLQNNGFSFKRRIIGNNLIQLKITLPFRAANSYLWQKLATKFSILMLKKKLRLKMAESCLWLAEPSMGSFSLLPFKLKLYDRCDLHGSFPGQNKGAWRAYEKEIFANVDLITFTHDFLLKDIPGRFSKKCLKVGNACSSRIKGVPKTRKRTAESRIDLVSSGAHFEWVDIKWLDMLANHPEIRLNIAGEGRGNEFKKLTNKNNVIFHGRLDHNELYRLYESCDVGLVPFKNSALTKAVDPIKAYEYAAAGLKIWAPPVKGLENNNLISAFIATADDLEKQLKSGVNKELQTVKVASWEQRLNRILDSLKLIG
jgi:glycosyltransferase involved in cell wall biosynthesis